MGHILSVPCLCLSHFIQTSTPTGPVLGGWFTPVAGPFVGRCIRVSLEEVQKADVGRRCVPARGVAILSIPHASSLLRPQPRQVWFQGQASPRPTACGPSQNIRITTFRYAPASREGSGVP